MERRFKDGVDYWNIDVDFFENKKVRLILASFGAKGVFILIMILNEIYRTCGYYKKWDNDDCLLMSIKTGTDGGCSPTLISEVVKESLKRSFFDKGVFERFGVLTSPEIQRRFLRIVGNSRDYIPMIQEYFLLNTSSRRDVTGATLSKLAFFSIDSKENAENLKGDGQNLKGSDKEQNTTEQERTEQHSGEENANARFPRDMEADFNRFWSAYPKKMNKQDAYKAFKGVKVPVETLCAALERQKQSRQWREDGGKYIPYPATWLRKGGWENEPERGYDGERYGNAGNASPGEISSENRWNLRPLDLDGN